MTNDPRDFLLQMLEPVTAQLSNVLAPPALRRVLESLFLELDKAFVPPDRQRARCDRLADNARWLGLAGPSFRKERFAARHVELQLRRQADEVVCLFTPVERQVAWGKEAEARGEAKATGLAHARRLVKRGGGVVVVSSHLGPMVYYGPMLTYFLAKRGTPPDMLIVANPPSNDRIEKQLRRYGEVYGSRLRYLVKPMENVDGFRDVLDEELAKGTWVLTQVDVLSGGRSTRTVQMFQRELPMPAIWGAVRLAARHGAPVLPLCARRIRADGMGLRVEPPFAIDPSEDGARVAQGIGTVIEGWVRKNPADWGLLPKVHKLV
jgi:lauroyl/myristoyl acyltransferase